jgi:hypothetical protein
MKTHPLLLLMVPLFCNVLLACVHHFQQILKHLAKTMGTANKKGGKIC